ncbi:hypothetical protein JCM3765_002587 [Sporobolomyces pararoseus]
MVRTRRALPPATAGLSPSPSSQQLGLIGILPYELIRHIFRRITPIPFRPSLYKARQTLHLNLRLVSKAFKALAEENLLEVIRMSFSRGGFNTELGNLLSLLGKTGLDSSTRIKVLILANLSPEEPTTTELLEQVSATSSLEELWYKSKIANRLAANVTEGDLKSFAWLTPFLNSSIKRLHLENVAIPKSKKFVFPQLEYLSFKAVALPLQEDLAYDLRSVRHFSVTFTPGSFWLLEALVPQLQSFSIPLLERQTLPLELAQTETPCIVVSSLTTFNSNVYVAQQGGIAHLRLEGNSKFFTLDDSVLEGPWPENSLKIWVESIENLSAPIKLRTIRLAESFDSLNRELPPSIPALLARLESACLAIEVEIIRCTDIL